MLIDELIKSNTYCIIVSIHCSLGAYFHVHAITALKNRRFKCWVTLKQNNEEAAAKVLQCEVKPGPHRYLNLIDLPNSDILVL